MIHKLFFSLITVFWILGISQGYVLGQDNSTEVEAQFTIRNRLDIDAMMKLAGYENRGDFLSIMEKVTGDYNWDRNVDKGDKFFIPKPIGMVEVEPVDAESEMMEIVEPKPEPEGYNPTYGSTYDRVMDRGYVICGTKSNFPGFSEKKFVEFEDRWVGFDADICRAVAVAVFGDIDGYIFKLKKPGVLGLDTNNNLEINVYPNPVRPGYNTQIEKIKISGLTQNVNIKITDIAGNLVAEAQSNINSRYRNFNLEIDGGTAFWNGQNLRNNLVSSGVYIIMMSDLDSLETKILKLMIIR